MDPDRFEGFLCGLFVGVFLTAGVATIASLSKENAQQRTAIKQGAARYHPTTGEFEWLTNVEED